MSAPVSAADSYAAQLGVVQPLPSMRTTLGPYLWRADFGSANMESVEYVGSHPLSHTFSPEHMGTPDAFDCRVSADPMSNYRVWFHCSVAGGRRGKQLRLCVRNLNNKKPLIGEGMLPLVRSTANPSWRRVAGVEFTTLNAPDGTGRIRSFLPAGDGDGDEEDEGEGNGRADADADGAVPEEDDEALVASLAASSIVAASSSSTAASPAAASSSSRPGSGLMGSAPASSATSSAGAPRKARPKAASKAASKPKVKHDTMELIILHTFDSDGEGDETFFAFCLPYSYTQLQSQLLSYEHRFARSVPDDVYFHRELLVHSLEGRRVDLLTISSQEGRCADASEPDLPGLYPLPTRDSHKRADLERMWAPATPAAASAAADASALAAAAAAPYAAEPRACRFSPSSGKLLVLLSARVHPGETPSSFLLQGALDFLLSTSDPRAAALRSHCVFKVVPMLNPDGVAHGYYRTDSLGQNLNRFYGAPTPALHPSIHAVRSLVAHWHAERAGSLYAYIDLHAHAMKRGLFVFGNHLHADLSAHARNVSFAKLVQLNSPYLSLSNCNFSAQNMRAKDARDGLSKEGAGRVAFYNLTGCAHCYTVEVNYHCGRSVNVVAPLPETPTVSRSSAAHEGTQLGSTVAASASTSTSSSAHTARTVDLSWQREDHLMAQESQVGPPVQYTQTHFRSMGKALMVALLDMLPPLQQTQAQGQQVAAEAVGSARSAPAVSPASSSNPYSRLPASEYANLAGVERWASQFIMAPPKKLVRKLSKTTKSATASAVASSTSAASAATKSASRSKSATPKASPAASPRASSSSSSLR